MSTFVLVHGAWRGGWVYKRVARLLRAAGHEVYTPSLAGCAEHSHLLNGDITLSTHIADITGLIRWEQLSNVILVGHSYGGMVITGVADAMSQHVRRLVYVDAVVPENGQSFLDVYPASTSRFIHAAGDNRGLFLAPPSASYFNANPADRELIEAMCTPFPVACSIERLALGPGANEIPERTYVLAENWEANPYVDNRQRYGDHPNWDFYSLPVGHDVMLAAPERLAEILSASWPGAATV